MKPKYKKKKVINEYEAKQNAKKKIKNIEEKTGSNSCMKHKKKKKK